MSDDTRSMAQLAQEALDVQDACNLSGVVHGFSRAISRVRELLRIQGSESSHNIATHPVCLLWADKVAHLTGIQAVGCDQVSRAYDAVYKLLDHSRDQEDIAF